MKLETLGQFYDFIEGKDTSKLFFFRSNILHPRTNNTANSFSMGMKDKKIDLNVNLSEFESRDNLITIQEFISRIESICRCYNVLDCKNVGFEFEVGFDYAGNLYLD